MAHDDRDRNFEKALARQLRSSYSGVESNAPARPALDSCPDPEILAAYHELALAPGELIFWKEHVVACSRCQMVLSQLAATEKITFDASPAEDPLLISERAPSPKERSRDSRSIDGERRPPSWRWVLLIPAGAIAAGLVAWVSLQQPKPLQVSPSSPVEVAESRPAPPVSSAAKPALVAPTERKQKDQPAAPSTGAAAGGALPERDALANALHKQAQAGQQTPYAYSTKTGPGPAVNMQRQEQQQQRAPRVVAGSASGRTVDQKKLEAQAPARISENSKSVASPAAPPPPPPAEPSFLDNGAVATPHAASAGKVSSAALAPASASNAATPKEKPANADAISAMSETVEVSSEPQTPARAKATILTAALQDPHVFMAPDGKHLWRVGPAGSLETSKDRGAKWALQTSGVNTDLLAGSAVSANVCWVVGNAGTILRTTDGGAHWTKLDSPVTIDLTGVRAIDAFHASIWFVSDQQTGAVKTYETMDGGASWSPIPPK